MLKIDNIEFCGYGTSLCYNFEVPSGSLSLISGPSGQGKTTLLSIIAGFIAPHTGQVLFNNQILNDLDADKRPLSILFQDHNLFPHLSVEQNIGLGLKTSLKLTSTERERIAEVAAELGIQPFLSKYPDELSGGQRQRVALARVLLRKRPLLLLDEPFVGLDHVCIKNSLQAIHKQKEKYNLTVLLVSHHYELLEQEVDQIVFV